MSALLRGLVDYGYALVELPGRQAIVSGSARGTFKVDLSPGGIVP